MTAYSRRLARSSLSINGSRSRNNHDLHTIRQILEWLQVCLRQSQRIRIKLYSDEISAKLLGHNKRCSTSRKHIQNYARSKTLSAFTFFDSWRLRASAFHAHLFRARCQNRSGADFLRIDGKVGEWMGPAVNLP